MHPDDHLIRVANEHMRRGNELMEEIRDEIGFNREVIRRNEVAFQENSHVLAELVESVREVRADLRDLGAEIRAQTEAIFRTLDRFDGGPETAGA